ncbi:MAG: hypothetical protein ABW217_20785 [Polyangiaceae bacterium]
MTTLTLRGELGRRVLITVHGYERDVGSDPYDLNWLQCTLDVAQGAFRGTVDASLTTSDFLRFLTELEQIKSRSSTVASFTTMEDALAFRVDVHHTGRATVTGTLREHGELAAQLSFAFESDHASLTAAHSDVRRIVAAFPERTPGE